MTTPRMPKGLGYQGQKLWRTINDEFDLTGEPGKLRTLFDAAKTADVVDRLQKIVDAAGDNLRVRGSQGQPVTMPELDSLRHYRALLAQLLGRLGLPDTDEAIAEKAEKLSQTRRQAGMQKYARHRKASLKVVP
jgi:hypothetical protein